MCKIKILGFPKISLRDDCKNKKVKNLGTCPKLGDPPPLTPLWEHKNLGTFYFSKAPPLMNLGTLILVSLVVLTLRPPN